MIRLDNTNITEAVEKHPQKSKAKIAAFADISSFTLDRVLNGETDLNLTSLGKLGEYFGFDIEVRFVAREKNGHTSNAKETHESPARV